MASHQPAVMKSLQHLFHHGPTSGLDDRQLLERFLTRHDEAAFAALVRGMVRSCWGFAAEFSATNTISRTPSRRRSWSSSGAPVRSATSVGSGRGYTASLDG